MADDVTDVSSEWVSVSLLALGRDAGLASSLLFRSRPQPASARRSCPGASRRVYLPDGREGFVLGRVEKSSPARRTAGMFAGKMASRRSKTCSNDPKYHARPRVTGPPIVAPESYRARSGGLAPSTFDASSRSFRAKKNADPLRA